VTIENGTGVAVVVDLRCSGCEAIWAQPGTVSLGVTLAVDLTCPSCGKTDTTVEGVRAP
jgi:hypothetical protein